MSDQLTDDILDEQAKPFEDEITELRFKLTSTKAPEKKKTIQERIDATKEVINAILIKNSI
jgi:hypothetical protein